MRDQYNLHDIMKRGIDKAVDDFEKQGIRLGIKQAKYDAAIEMIKQNVPVDEIERITGVTLQTKFPEECMPNSSAAKYIKKGFDSGLILGREEINNKKEYGQFH
ncbi:MAG: hypothetical protein V2J08_10555 [Desulfotignum sp.]|jgi:hypothetical protein|nr:hypothetical protein [Desulfotignum sp.]